MAYHKDKTNIAFCLICLQVHLLSELVPKVQDIFNDPADPFQYERNLLKAEVYYEDLSTNTQEEMDRVLQEKDLRIEKLTAELAELKK